MSQTALTIADCRLPIGDCVVVVRARSCRHEHSNVTRHNSIVMRRNAETLLAELGEALSAKELTEAEALSRELVLEDVVAECLKQH